MDSSTFNLVGLQSVFIICCPASYDDAQTLLRVILSCSTCAPYLLDSLQLYFACIDNKVLIQTWNLFQLLFFDQVLWLFSHGSKEEELLKIHIETGMAIESDTLDAL
jgi:hypothetical protein